MTQQEANNVVDPEEFLNANKLSEAVDAFRERDISIEELLEYDESDLKQIANEIGLGALSRARFVKAIAKLKQQAQAADGNLATEQREPPIPITSVQPLISSTTEQCKDEYVHAIAEEKEEEQKSEEDKDEEESVESKDEAASLQLMEIKKIPCDSCNVEYSPDQLFVCKHMDCLKPEDLQIWCEKCGKFQHQTREKEHAFDPNARHIKCLASLLDLAPDQQEFMSAKDTVYKLAISVRSAERFLWYHRWVFTVPSLAAACGGQVAASYIWHGCSPVFAACGAQGSVVASGLGASAVGGAIGAVIATGIEAAFIWRQWHLDRISTKEAWTLTAISFGANVASAAGWLAGSAIGAAIGTSGGPAGIAIGVLSGAAVGALFSLLFRFGANKGTEYYYKHKKEAKTEMQKQALLFFFHDKNYDVSDANKFNKQILEGTYHLLAKVLHPDAPKNVKLTDKDEKEKVQQEWLRLSGYYGVLTAILEKRDKVDVDVADCNEDTKAEIVAQAIKSRVLENAEDESIQNNLLTNGYQ